MERAQALMDNIDTFIEVRWISLVQLWLLKAEASQSMIDYLLGTEFWDLIPVRDALDVSWSIKKFLNVCH